MFLLASQHSMAVPLGDRGFALRAAGLIVLAIGTYLAIGIPPVLANQRRARQAQLAVGLYTLMSAGAVGVCAFICSQFSPGWFHDDRLCDASTLSFATVLVLLGALLTLYSTKMLPGRNVSLGTALIFPLWVFGIFNTILLCYFWFGPTDRAGGPQPNAQGTFILEIIAVAIALIAVIAALVQYSKRYDVRPMLGQAALAAISGAAAFSGLIALRAPHSEFSRQNLFGFDLMLIGAVLGVAVFAGAFLVARRSGAQSVPDVPARPALAA